MLHLQVLDAIANDARHPTGAKKSKSSPVSIWRQVKCSRARRRVAGAENRGGAADYREGKRAREEEAGKGI